MIVIPMAGMSSRFFNAGYEVPKFMLVAHGLSLFEHSMLSFSHYFESEHFVFILRDTHNTKQFVEDKLEKLGISSFDIVVLECETRGQAETVALGLSKYRENNHPITIFNIDTIRYSFHTSVPTSIGDGYLEVFLGTGDNWSYVKPDHTGRVIETAEKKPISDLCSTGLYVFSDIQDFYWAYEEYSLIPDSQWTNGEIYIAPLYNLLIEKGKVFKYVLVDPSFIRFVGTPDEYNDFLRMDLSK